VTILMLSRGVPMLLGGDEIRRTQGGNNNAYNQDNATSWLDWTMIDANRGLLRFVQRMIAFRKAHRALTRPHFYRGETNERGVATSRGMARRWERRASTIRWGARWRARSPDSSATPVCT
jgi:pullulanase/glycogen debranching enzyme